ncbi:MAG: NADH-quinone oxidoreductase subunit C [Myxococcota bacterium]
MNISEVYTEVKKFFPEKLSEVITSGQLTFFYFDRDIIKDLFLVLRDKIGMEFKHLSYIASVDLKDRFELVYCLYSYRWNSIIHLKTRLPRDNPVVSSIADLYVSAEWHEREAYDLMGILFEGHPDLRRIMMPDDFEGHPLRKDFSERDNYHGMPTSREKILGKY